MMVERLEFLTDFYGGDVMAISATDELRKAYKTTVLDPARSYIDTVKTFPLNIEVVTSKTYRTMESPIDNSIGAVTYEFNTSMLLLPKIGYIDHYTCSIFIVSFDIKTCNDGRKVRIFNRLVHV